MGTTRTVTAGNPATRRSTRPRKRFPGPLAGLKSDAECFESLKRKLLARPDFEDRYVAVLRCRMVGTDSDQIALFKRVTAKYGDVPFYIGRLEREPRVKRIPSPHITRRQP